MAQVRSGHHITKARSVPTLYDVLGTSPGATQDELRHAYHRRAQLLHPDRHARAPEDLLQEAQRAMADLNAAWEVLGDPASRAGYDLTLNGQAAAEGPDFDFRTPEPDECMFCGSAPAIDVTLRQETGKILWRTRRSLDGAFCRDCGLAAFRSMTNRTLITGWWGVISFFVNWTTIARNVGVQRRIGQLSPPRRKPEVVAPLARPLNPGKPLHKRAGIYVAAVALVVVAGVAIGSAAEEPTTGNGSDSPSDLVGECITIRGNGSIGGVVDCENAHDGRVVAVEFSESRCPASADVYFESRTELSVLCVDTDR